MRAFREINIADVCAPFEAVEWIYLGRVPEWLPGLKDDMRKDIVSLVDDFSLESRDLTSHELEAYGLKIDIGLYWDALSDIDDKEPQSADYDERFGRWREYAGPPNTAWVRAHELLSNIEAILGPSRAKAELRVMLALVDGSLQAYGFRVPSGWVVQGTYPVSSYDGVFYDPEDLYRRAKIEPIPPTMWRNVPEVWKYGTGASHPEGFVGCWVETSEVMRLFPQPEIPSSEVQLIVCGNIGRVEEGHTQTLSRNASTTAGRKPIGNGLVERSVVAEFIRRKNSGELPEKKEAVIAECIEWARSALGVSLGRSTAQRYLTKIYAQN